MKVAVITRHAITNYGSLLQAIATQQLVESLGNACEIIDYIRDDETYQNQEAPVSVMLSSYTYDDNYIIMAGSTPPPTSAGGWG